MSLRIAAGFDALAVTKVLTLSAGGAAAAELHVFAYLGCLLGVYDGQDASEWQYGFMATPAGAPYAPLLAEEVDRLRASGRLLDRGDVLVLSAVGEQELVALRSFPSLELRSRYVDAACGTASLRPLPSVADALSQEPQLQQALELHGSRELLTETGRLLLEPHFRGLRDALHERFAQSQDLLVPAAVWLNYLSAVGQRRVRDALAQQPAEEPA